MTGAEKPPQLVMKESLDTLVETVIESAELAASTNATVVSTDEKVTQLLAQFHNDTAREVVKETVAALAAKLATMPPTTLPSADMALLLADCRDTITEGIGALHTQGADVLHALQILQAPPAKPVPPTYPWWMTGAAGLVAGLALMGPRSGGHGPMAGIGRSSWAWMRWWSNTIRSSRLPCRTR